MIIITDILKHQFDEGAKVAVYNLLSSMKKQFSCVIVLVNSNRCVEFADYQVNTNKLLFNNTLYSYLREKKSKQILYIPEASITFLTFVRAKLLNLFCRKRVTILSFQPRQYSAWQKKIIALLLKPAGIITQSKQLTDYLVEIGISSSCLPLGVDVARFICPPKDNKNELRKKYSLPDEHKILLHVGHIKKSRNLEWLIEVKKKLPKLFILVVGSTTTEKEDSLLKLLQDNNISIYRQYAAAIEEFYQLADYYVFPVIQNSAAIETPLSVLEAMATDLPVLTTCFGSLPKSFKENSHFRYIHSAEDIISILEEGFKGTCKTRQMVRHFSWDKIAKDLRRLIEE